jgi:two-component system, OmpR family, phosphate regulon sensor histidine kinase PhoR
MIEENKGNLFLRYLIMITAVFILIGIVAVPFLKGDDSLFIILALFIGYIVILVLMYHVFENYVKPIRASVKVTKELVKGNYNVRTYVKPIGEAQELSELINKLARNFQEMYLQEKMQGSQWKTVINNMESGLMLIDERGYVHLVNRKFLKMFGKNSMQYIGYLYYDVLEEKAIHKVVQETFLYEEKITEAITRTIEAQKHHIEVVGAPVINDVKELKGAVLVFHDITELKRVEQMRKDFVANVSHELKTPITSIRGFSETLLDGAMEDEELCKQFLQIILKESTRLQALVQDLLELSKLEKEEMKLMLKTIHIDEWITSIQTLMEQQAKAKSISFQSTIDGGITFIADPDRMQQVVLNLLYNAINYTGEGGTVTLRIEAKESDIHISITDTGIGIPEDSIQRIFERFYRVDRARSRNTGGTGLGLAIVKHIVEAHKGKILVESMVNKGSTFTVILPKEW